MGSGNSKCSIDVETQTVEYESEFLIDDFWNLSLAPESTEYALDMISNNPDLLVSDDILILIRTDKAVQIIRKLMQTATHLSSRDKRQLDLFFIAMKQYAHHNNQEKEYLRNQCVLLFLVVKRNWKYALKKMRKKIPFLEDHEK